jgi:hypothetical protein
MSTSLDLGSLGPILRQEPAEVQLKVREAVAERLRVHLQGDTIPMVSACWLVRAST